MLQYRISYEHPNLHWLTLQLIVDQVGEDSTFLQLPAWRPGRYELGNFAKNIRNFSVQDAKGKTLPFHKATKDRWEVPAAGAETLTVTYEYYAGELNAGSTWLDEEQVYINFVNCLLFVEDRPEEGYRVKLDLPKDYQIAGGLEEVEHHVLEAPNFYRLAESPIIASAQLTHWQYEVDGPRFHLWFQGKCYLDEATTLERFKAFTQVQMQMMGGFPTDDYHFLYHLLPYRAYHGVEHFNSTVIALGPTDQLREGSALYYDFLGVSSHELFHTWNIIRIRPREMMPYDYTRENYFATGFVAEGITTYYGDLFLVRSGVLTRDEYFLELNKLLQRHFDNFGRFNHSLVDSSWDLWLDGYVPGVPDRKVSIYVKGALVSLILDLELRRCTEGEQSLDTLMQYLWGYFGKKERGYSLPNLQKLVSDLSGNELNDYFDRFIFGIEPLEDALNEALRTVGCQLVRQESARPSERSFGFRTGTGESALVVQKIAPDSPAARGLSLGDKILAIDGLAPADDSGEGLLVNRTQVELTVLRQHRVKTLVLEADRENYFSFYTIEQREDATLEEQAAFEAWLGSVEG